MSTNSERDAAVDPHDMTSVIETTGIRKAAVLVASLDREAGDLVLDRMGPDQAQRVREAILELGAIDPGEQRQVIREFRGTDAAARQKYPPGIELDGALAQMLGGRAAGGREPVEPDPPFRFLRDTETDKLAAILAGERPQVIALVLSHLPPERAGDVLAELAPSLQADVIRRLADLKETDPAILREVEQGLQSRLAKQIDTVPLQAAGLPAVAGILKAAGRNVGTQILGNLAAHDPALLDQLGPARFDFEDLTRFGDAALRTVLAAAEPDVVALALLGAPPSRIARFLGMLSLAEAEWVRHELADPRPTRLADVEESRRRLAELARHLVIEGRIEMPADQPIPMLT